MVLDFSNYKTITGTELHEDWWAYATPRFEHLKECIYCNSKLSRPIEHEVIVEPGEGWNEISFLYDCLNCGWWYYQNEAMKLGSNGQYALNNEMSFSGILRKFEISDIEIPLTTLKNEIFKNNSYLYQINPTKFEILVADIFKEFFNCVVKHVGKSNDGGVDLILVRSETDFIVQIKRRENPHSTESVSVIRELVGAMVLSGKKNAIFVSTADKYSKQAIESSIKVKAIGVANSFSLIDFKKFVEILNLTHMRPQRCWEEILPKLNTLETK
jgi:restriction system protein